MNACLVAAILLVGQPTDAAVLAQAAQLDPKLGKDVRLKALSWLGGHPATIKLARPALERCVRADPDPEVRGRAVQTLCNLTVAGGECPLAVVEALLDAEDIVRWNAMAYMPAFKTFAAGSVDVLLRGVQLPKAHARGDCLLILGRAGRGNDRAVAALERVTGDKVFEVRANAHIGLFHAHDTIARHLPYLIRLRDDPKILEPIPDDPKRAEEERVLKNLLILGSMNTFAEWSATRTDEFADALLKLTGDESPLMRRGAVALVGTLAEKIEWSPPRRLTDPLSNEPPRWLLELLDLAAKKENEAPKELSQLAVRLGKLKIDDHLRRLRADADPGVREAAVIAAERLANLRAKSGSGK